MTLFFNIILSSKDSMLAIAVGVMCVVVFSIISWTVSSSKEKISEVRFKNKPDDIKLLQKFAVKDLQEGKTESAKTKLERLLENDKNNFAAIIYLSIIYYKNGEYEKSKTLLYYFTTNVNVIATTSDEFLDHSAFGLALYYLSHFLYLDGDNVKAEYYKKAAISYNENVLNNQLHSG